MYLEKDIVKEGNSLLNQKCKKVSLPLSSDDEACIRGLYEYMVVSAVDELVEKYDSLTGRRGMGFMQGLVCTLPVGEVCAKALEQGLIVISAGSDVIRLVPPLVIEKEHIDEMVDKLSKVLDEMAE